MLNSWKKRSKFLKGLTKHLALGKPIKGSKQKKRRKTINKFKSFDSTVKAYDKKRRKRCGYGWWLVRGMLKKKKAERAVRSLDWLILYKGLLSRLASRSSRSFKVTNRRIAALRKVVTTCNNLSVIRPGTTGVVRRPIRFSLGTYVKGIARLYNKKFKTIRVLSPDDEARAKKSISDCRSSRNELTKAERRVESKKQPRPTLDSENPNLSRRLRSKKLWFEARLAKAAVVARRKLKVAKFVHLCNKRVLSNLLVRRSINRIYTKSGGAFSPNLNRKEFRRLTNESNLLMGTRKRSMGYLRRLIAG
jgi:hypothetical protein